jgi:hypothetical protein
MTDETRLPSPLSDPRPVPVPVIPRDAKGRRIAAGAAPAVAAPAEPAEAEPAAPPEPEAEAAPYREPAKRMRIPVGLRRSKLYAPQRPGFHRRWVNDLPGRVEVFMNGGWDMVSKDGKPWMSNVSQSEKMMAYLMEIPDEFYNEDFAAKQEALDETDFAIYRGRLNEEPGDHRYVPRSTPIKMSVERGTGKG